MPTLLRRIGLWGLLIALPACAPQPAPDDRDTGAPTVPGVRFVDSAIEAGLDLTTRCGDIDKQHLLESTGTGVAVADYDGDGLEDIYLPTAQTTEEWLAGQRPRHNALYRSNGDGTFFEVAASAGVALAAWSSGAYFVDYDNDGDKDLFVTAWGPNVLYRNDGDGTFSDVTEQAGVSGPDDAWSTSAAWGDLDGDGDLELYVANYCEYDLRNPPFGTSRSIWKGIAVYPGPRGFVAQIDELYLNDGRGGFTEIGERAGIRSAEPLYGLGVVMSDLDDDGDLDIYVANDSVPNRLWRNDGDLRFAELGAFAAVATNEDGREQAGMGTDAADFDGDGRMDLIVTNFSHEWNTLHRNQGGMYFVDSTFESGFRDSYLKLVWGTKFFDFDGDGWLDVFVANGHIYPEVDEHPHLNTAYKQSNTLYRNRGGGRFEDVTASAGAGLAIIESTRGTAVADLDLDGDLELVLSNIDATPNLLRNDGGNRAGWVMFELTGTRSNRDAIGARLTLEAGGQRQVRELNPFGSYQSQSSYRVHFGLGSAETIERLTVRWPSGREELRENLPGRRLYRLVEGIQDLAEPGS